MPEHENGVDLPTASWCGDHHISLPVPHDWEVVYVAPSSPPALSPSELQEALLSPVSGPPLQELLDSVNSVAVVVDDFTRPTPWGEVLHWIISQARECGIADENIKVVVALGTHVLEDRAAMDEKLGPLRGQAINMIYPDCTDHKSYVHFGTTRSGHPLLAHRDLVQADLKVTISGVYPHDDAGFSGGAKILIGTLGLRTISSIHRGHPPLLRGSVLRSAFREELEEIADTLELDYSINLVLNERKGIVFAASGDPRTSFDAAVEVAQQSLEARLPSRADVVISNAYPFDTSLSVLGKSKWPFASFPDAPVRILMTSLCRAGDRRVPFAASDAEHALSTFKRRTGLSKAKRFAGHLFRELRHRFVPQSIWRSPVVYVTRKAVSGEEPARRRRFVAGHPAFEDWDALVHRIEADFPKPDGNRVAVVVPCAPLLFPGS